MGPAEYVQLAILAVIALSVVTLLWQTRIQNRLLRAQLLRDRLDTYWKTYEPISDNHVRDFETYPDDFMRRELYQRRYAGKPDAIRRYIKLSQLYEFLAFSHTIGLLRLEDPLGPHWTRLWTDDLVESTEFLDVHRQYGGYYPEYERFVEARIRAKAQGSAGAA